MAKFMIDLSDDPSKAEEIIAIRKIADKLPPKSYLKKLFTPDFQGWVIDAIRSDIFPDMMDHFQGAMDKVSELEANRDFVRKENEKEVKFLRERMNVRDGAIRELTENLEECVQQRETLRKNFHTAERAIVNERSNQSSMRGRFRRALESMREFGRRREQNHIFALEQVIDQFAKRGR